MTQHNYRWKLSDNPFRKDRGKVFSTFSCGGGSSMGYKLSGFDVIGCNDIDPKMMSMYVKNHAPQYSFICPVKDLLTMDLPQELYELDILDGSPPCSTFSMAGNREKDWGKERKFREGQAEQVLDNLFFDFIDLAAKLQPKVVIAENVSGLLLGNAFAYVQRIYEAFAQAGYECQHWLLDASRMGVPQQRCRVFFVCLRKDLAEPIMQQVDFFSFKPPLHLEFSDDQIPYRVIEDRYATDGEIKMYPSVLEMWERCRIGDQMERTSGHTAISHYRVDPDKVLNTIIGSDAAGAYHYKVPRSLTTEENCLAGTFPLDYDFDGNQPKYVIGMSVPPVMMARVADRVWDQWLSVL